MRLNFLRCLAIYLLLSIFICVQCKVPVKFFQNLIFRPNQIKSNTALPPHTLCVFMSLWHIFVIKIFTFFSPAAEEIYSDFLFSNILQCQGKWYNNSVSLIQRKPYFFSAMCKKSFVQLLRTLILWWKIHENWWVAKSQVVLSAYYAIFDTSRPNIMLIADRCWKMPRCTFNMHWTISRKARKHR